MERKNIAIVGNTDAILPFNTFGVHCVKVSGSVDANEKVKILAISDYTCFAISGQ